MKLFILILTTTFALTSPHAKADENSMVNVHIELKMPGGIGPVFITGNHDILGPWRPDGILLSGDGTLRAASLKIPKGFTLEYSFTLGDWHQKAVGPSGTILPNYSLVVEENTVLKHEVEGFSKDPKYYIDDVKGSGVQGELKYWLDVPSKYLSETRHVGIWLPPGYNDNPNKHYPVIYMSDGHALFDPRIDSDGIDWGVDEAMIAGIEAGKHPAAIIVGVWNTKNRVLEYSPWHDGPKYARFLIEELKPKIDQQFRTKIGPSNTFHAGSSMGGLISFLMVRDYPETFSACGCLSSHVSFSHEMFERFVDGSGLGEGEEITYMEQDILAEKVPSKGQRLLMDYGTEGLDGAYHGPHEKMRELLLRKGFIEGKDFQIEKHQGDGHNIPSWRKRVGHHFEFMLSKPPQEK